MMYLFFCNFKVPLGHISLKKKLSISSTISLNTPSYIFIPILLEISKNVRNQK